MSFAHYKLGKLPKTSDHRDLVMRKFLPVKLPPPPATCDYFAKVHGSLGLYDNDQKGDCAWAGAAHQIIVETATAGKQFNPQVGVIVAGYIKMSPDDEGCVLRDVLKLWRNAGIAGHKIGAFAAIDPANTELIKQAINLLGSVYLGVALPIAIQDATSEWILPKHWTPTGSWQPGSWGGHCVQASKYDDKGIYISTWGQIFFVSWQFFVAYFDEAWGTFSTDFICGNGCNINGVPKDVLLDDLEDLAA